MEHKRHPTHLRRRLRQIGLWVGVLIGFFVASTVALKLYGRFGTLENVLAASWIALGLLALFSIVKDGTKCRCAQCGKQLKAADIRSDKGTRKFYCPVCDILWDSGIEENAR